ncbi:MAG: hypothetical protein ACUVUC_12025 [Thermoguttaceae bacterium]
MSVGPMGGLGASAAGTPLAQAKGPEIERTEQELANQHRRVQNEIRAENASGIGEADGEDHQTAERDADGRRFWEEATARKVPQPPEQDSAAGQRQSRDATGQAGRSLDITG